MIGKLFAQIKIFNKNILIDIGIASENIHLLIAKRNRLIFWIDI